MKKISLALLALSATSTISSTRYVMNINMPDGTVHEEKVYNTDSVTYDKKGDEVTMKVTRKDSSFSYYPFNDAEVTFSKEIIARIEGDINNWETKPIITSFDGCKLDTTLLHYYREELKTLEDSSFFDDNSYEELLSQLYEKAIEEYNKCIYYKQSEIDAYIYKLSNKYRLTNAEEDVLNAANLNAAKFFAEVTKEHQNENIIFSPTSLQFALAMIANGTDNDSLYSKLTSALGKQDIPLSLLNTLYEKRMVNLQLVTPSSALIQIKNASFLQNGIRYGKDFLENLSNHYGAIATNVDFSDLSTYDKMDEWVSETTNGMIPKMRITPNSNLKLVISNALSFQAKWEDEFDESHTELDTFITSSGEIKDVEMMYQYDAGLYAEGSNYKLVSKRFDGCMTNNINNHFNMYFILPNEGVTPEQVLEEFDFNNIPFKYPEYIASDVKHVHYPIIHLPKFNVDSEINLYESLIKMGLGEVFNSKFNYIAEDDIALSEAKQLAHLEIDEEGAKGAAFTHFSWAGSNPPLTVVTKVYLDFNRPFIVSIVNRNIKEVLFLGLINDPTIE